MATIRQREPDAGEVLRSALVAKWRQYEEWFGQPSPEFPTAPERRIDAMERGERVRVAGWELCNLVPDVGPYGWWIVEPDGSLTPTTAPHPE